MCPWRITNGVWVLLLAAVIAAPAQTFTTLANFNWKDGAHPWYVAPVQGINGNFFGTTFSGGTRTAHCDPAYPGCGGIFEMTAAGAITIVHKFDGTDGANPMAGLLLAASGDFYAATSNGGGGLNDCGTIYRVTPGFILHVFQGADGCGPNELIEGADGNFYGTTVGGGPYPPKGTVFKITPEGTLTTLHNFSGSDGAEPLSALLEGADGNFYGTTQQGGVNDCGTIFKVTPDGSFTSLYGFCDDNSPYDGVNPYGALVQDRAGNLYGTTSEGGGNGCCGTVYQMTAAGEVTTLHAFCPYCPDGYYVYDKLLLATDGNLYGTTDEVAGTIDCGIIFRITPAGAFTVLHTFDGTDGCNSQGGLSQGTDGALYGAATFGGAGNYGTVYRLSVGLGPYVKTLPHSGRPGAAIKILGTNLAGTTSVRFHGMAAEFTVISRTEIDATVPESATTGDIQVQTPGGTLRSGGAFLVRPK